VGVYPEVGLLTAPTGRRRNPIGTAARRSDSGALTEQLAMSAEERMQSAAALHNAMAEMKAGLGG
jgi:hypothetical protein